MDEIPPDLLAALPEGAASAARKWWATLEADDRVRLAGLWDRRLEVRFFEPQADDEGKVDRWSQIPVVECGRFVPHDNDGRLEWQPGYFEYLLQHPELVVAYEPPRRTFHMGCTIHEAARECVRVGIVPSGFDCPLELEECPLLLLRGASLTNCQRKTESPPDGI